MTSIHKNPKRSGKRNVVILLLAALFFCAWGGARIAAKQAARQPAVGCPGDMQGVPGGVYPVGSSVKIVEYLMQFCRNTIGDCDELWFAPETPRRAVALRPFCIDKYEYPNRKGQPPLTNRTWKEAGQICRSGRKRLCNQWEWEAACAGPSGRVWPYDHRFVPGACAEGDEGKIQPSGAHPYCASPFRVYDMSGNAAEWTDSIAESQDPRDKNAERVVRGGSWKDTPIFTRCAFQESYSPDTNNEKIGFRCCMNSQ